MIIYYFIVLILIAFLHQMFYTYIKNNKIYENFMEDNTSSILKNTTKNYMNNVVEKITEIEALMEASMVTYSQNLEEDMISDNSRNQVDADELGGTYSDDFNTYVEYAIKNADEEKCLYKPWLPQTYTTKEDITKYISILNKEFNSNIIKLYSKKRANAIKLQTFKMVFSDYLDHALFGKCMTCGEIDECKNHFCNYSKSSDDYITINEQNRNRIRELQIELEHNLCEYIVLYKYTADVLKAIQEYTSKLDNQWTTLDINNIKIELTMQ